MRGLLSRLDRVQRGRTFKIVASAVVVLAALVSFVLYSVRAAKLRDEQVSQVREAYGAMREQEAAMEREFAAQSGETAEGEQDPTSGIDKAIERPDSAIDASARVVEGVIASRHGVGTVGISLAVGTGLALGAIWLGLGLTYLGLGVVCALGLVVSSRVGVAQYGLPVVGVVALVAAFAAIMRLLGLAVGGSGPVLGVARNVLTEAVRMRVSLVFIVLLIFGLACLPLILDAEQPLRYRMQSFLQYSTGGAFWLIAVLTVLFSVSTVASEQRDRVIWQTMTKPVSAWQYVLGKWLGVTLLAGALLVVSTSGIFLFVGHLRSQPAQGEASAYSTRDGSLISEDRMALETQVLAARTLTDPDPWKLDAAALEQEIQERIREELRLSDLGEALGETPAQRLAREQILSESVRSSLLKNIDAAHRSLSPGETKVYTFSGLSHAKQSSRPIILQYKVDTGSNMPDQVYRITVSFPGLDPGKVYTVPLGQRMTVQLLPTIIDAQGKVTIAITNGDLFQRIPNPGSFTMPPDGFVLAHSVSSFEANYLRLVVVLWVKLAFLAMIGVFCSTFLSFSVASFVAFAVFLAAETSTSMLKSLDVFSTQTNDGKDVLWKQFVAWLTKVVGNLFKVYGDLRPTTRLVEGLHLSWGGLAFGSIVLAALSAVLFVAGAMIFRRRELAMYSGN